MTATATPYTRAQRSARRLRLLTLIARASDELVALERADRRATGLTADVTEPSPAEVTAGNTLATPTARIRAWATEQGLPLGPRGPLPKAIRAAYTAAHPQEPTP